MIIGFIGQRNSGKTLSMTVEAYKKFKQGFKIYSNYHLNFDYTPYTVDDLILFAESGMYFDKCLFLIDESHIYFDSRSSQKKRSIIFAMFLNQSSKNNCDVYYTTQYARQVEIRLRLNTEVVVECNSRCIIWKTKDSKPVMEENVRPKPNDYRCKAYVYNKIIKFSDTGLDKVTRRVYNGEKYYSLYDTRQVIKQQSDMFERAKLGDKRNKIEKVVKPKKESYKEKRELQKLNRVIHNPNIKQRTKDLKKFKNYKICEVDYNPREVET
jgi:hypothetical protein